MLLAAEYLLLLPLLLMLLLLLLLRLLLLLLLLVAALLESSFIKNAALVLLALFQAPPSNISAPKARKIPGELRARRPVRAPSFVRCASLQPRFGRFASVQNIPEGPTCALQCGSEVLSPFSPLRTANYVHQLFHQGSTHRDRKVYWRTTLGLGVVETEMTGRCFSDQHTVTAKCIGGQLMGWELLRPKRPERPSFGVVETETIRIWLLFLSG
jgi:hypothetical protein